MQSKELKPIICLRFLFFLTFIIVTTAIDLPFATSVYAAERANVNVCSLQIEIIAAPFAVVDSNKPGVEGPRAATLAARIINKGATDLNSIQVSIGNGVTPGVFNTNGGKGLALFAQEATTKTLMELAAGENTVLYWTVSYPTTYNVDYPYTIWATSADGCSTTQSRQLTTHSEISAEANKVFPVGSLLQVSPNTVVPGNFLTVKITGFSLGTVGQGPEGSTPYDAWVQPIGNLDFDPSCVRLVRSEVLLKSMQSTPYVNQLYFSNLHSYSNDRADYVAYTFLALRECTTVVQPYHEAASGKQEKYSADFEASATRIQIKSAYPVCTTNPCTKSSGLQLNLTASQTNINPGDNVQLSINYSATTGTIGSPTSGSPVVITSQIPSNATYVAGSATSVVPSTLQYSADGGLTWQTTAPADLTTVTHLRWLLHDPVDATTEVIRYNITINNTFTGGALNITATAGLLGSDTLDSDTEVLNGIVPTPTPTPTPTATPDPGVGSGGDGGLESGPLPGDPSAFIGQIGNKDVASANAAAQSGQMGGALHKARLLSTFSLQLEDLMPTTGPNGTTPKAAIPADVLAITNAPDAKAIDFVNPQGQVKGAVLGILSLGGPYEHDYGVCNRFKEYTFDTIEPVAIPTVVNGAPSPRWFWHAHSLKGETLREDALLLHIFVDEGGKRLHVDSRWTKDSYPTTPTFAYDYIFNLQIWSTDLANSQTLLSAILERLPQIDNGAWEIVYHNTDAPESAQIYVNQVRYNADSVELTLSNALPTEQTVRIYGAWRSQVDRNTLQPLETFAIIASAQSQLRLSYPALLDITLYLEHNNFTDKIYTGGGLWFPVRNTVETTANLAFDQCRPLDAIDNRDLLMAGCTSLTTGNLSKSDEAGIGRTLNPNGLPVDVSPYKALRFWAKGDDKPVRIVLESNGIADADYYQTIFTPDRQWRQYVIPLANFKQRGFGRPVALTGMDIKAVVWLNAEATGAPMSLAIDQASFTNAGLLQITPLAQQVNNTSAQNVEATAPDAAAVAQMILHYSLNGGDTFTAVPMIANGEANGALRGRIPGQQFGADVTYYLEAQHTNGYQSYSPVDAPASLYRYRVDDRSSLLVDDFSSGHLRNRLGEGNGLFNNPSAGGLLRAYQFEQQLVLDYNVNQSGQFAGYFTQLGSMSAVGYKTLNLLVRGETGGEQLLIGLRDATDYEPRLSVGDLLPGGISREWQWVQIPLSSFSDALDVTRLETLSLFFEQGYAPTSGRVYVKEMRFTSLSTPAVIDRFDDHNQATNSQGLGYWSTAVQGSLQAQLDTSEAVAPTGASLRLDYAIEAGGYGIWQSSLNKLAVAADGTLSFWVKGAIQGTTPAVYLTDGVNRARVGLEDYVTVKDTWQQVFIPLRQFANQGVNLQHLTAFQLVIEYGAGNGSLWLDHLQLNGIGAPAAEQRVFSLTNQDQTQVALHLPNADTWSIHSSATWLSASGSGAGSDTLTISTVNWELAPGGYSGQLLINTASGQTETLTVNLTVTETGAPAEKSYLPLIQR